MAENRIPETLRAAAQYIREHGWIKHTMRGPHGEACALGSIDLVIQKSATQPTWTDECPLFSACARQLFMEIHPHRDVLSYDLGPAIAHWNDMRGTKKEDVIQALENAATRYENQCLPALTVNVTVKQDELTGASK